MRNIIQVGAQILFCLQISTTIIKLIQTFELKLCYKQINYEISENLFLKHNTTHHVCVYSPANYTKQKK